MKHSEQLNELAAALAAAQAEIEDAEKCKANPAFRSKYADLGSVWDACKPALSKHGLSVAQFCEPSERGTLRLVTMLLHKSGQFLSGAAELPLAKEDPQGYGSALTYARRYGLAAMVGVCPEDDDGNAASGHGRPTQSQSPRQTHPRAQQAMERAPSGNAYSFETGARQAEPPRQEAPDLHPTPPTETGESSGLACVWDGCGKPLTKGQHDVSVRAYGHALCPAHQKEAREQRA